MFTLSSPAFSNVYLSLHLCDFFIRFEKVERVLYSVLLNILIFVNFAVFCKIKQRFSIHVFTNYNFGF